MKAVYQCQHCMAATIVKIEGCKSGVASNILNFAYGNDAQRQLAMGLTPYRPHECEPHILGVAQLVAIRDD